MVEKNKKKKVTRINLEQEFDDKKGIYVLSYTDKQPYKIGMTNAEIYKRINSYVNCPSQHDGHWIHLLLTYPTSSTISAKEVEREVFKLIKEKYPKARANSTQRYKNKGTEHFYLSIDQIQKVLVEIKDRYNKQESKPFMKVTRLKNKTVKTVKVKNGVNEIQMNS